MPSNKIKNVFQTVKKWFGKAKVWIIVVVMAAVAVLPFTMMKCGTSDAFTMWLSSGEQDQYYMDYSDNPIIKYLSQKEWGEGDYKTKLDFVFHSSHISAQDEFSNLVGDPESCDDVMALDYSQMSILELYKKGVAMDLTEYVLGEDSIMPNYKALIESDPTVYREAITLVDGEPKVIQLLSLNDAGRDMYQGLMYRRDWLVRFGEMPEYVWATNADEILELDHDDRQSAAPTITNYYEAKTAYGNNESLWTANGWKKNPLYTNDDMNTFEVRVGGTRGHGIVTTYGEDAMNDYTDNLVFPSGTKDPVFLSDWEWMFQTFEEKVWNNSSYTDSKGITLNKNNSYMMSVYFYGTSTRGDFSSAFGGGGPGIYYDKNTGKLRNGMAEERTRLYLEYMQGWYQKGWLDNDFTTRNSDMFYKIDESSMIEGRIPAYIGHRMSQIGNYLDSDSQPLTKGIMVVGAPLPINDVSGDSEYRFVEPDTLYQEGKVSSKCMITTAAEGKNIRALLSFIDYLYSTEGAEIASLGFNKEQYEEIQDSFYKKYNMTNGAYYKVEDDGSGKIYKWAEGNPESSTLNTALRLHRVPFGLHYLGACDHGYTKIDQDTVDCWNKYPNTGDVFSELTAKVSADKTYNTAYTEYMNTLTTKLAAPIKTKSATTFNASWNNLVSARGWGDTLVEYLQKVLDDYNNLEIG